MKKIILQLMVLCIVIMVGKQGIGKDGTVMEKICEGKKANRYVLDNGMTLLLKEDHKNPVSAIEVWIKTGSVTEDKYAGGGISHFLEHMLFKGTKKRKVGDIAKEIQFYGGEINAHTSFDYTVYTVSIDSRYFHNACEILSDVLMHSQFDAREVEKERSVILKEINMNDDDPQRRIFKMLFNTMFTVHPYKDPIIGYESVFKTLTREDLINYYKTRYVPNNIVFVAAGDFAQKETKKYLQELFKEFPRGIDKPVFVPREPQQLGDRTLVETADINKVYYFSGYHTTDLKHNDKYALDVLSMILGQGRSSRLYRTLREKLSLVSSISSWSFTPIYPGVFAVTATFDPKNIVRVGDEIQKQIDAIKNEYVSKNELEKVKKLIISEYFFSMETVSGQASDIGYNEVATGNCHYSKDYVQKIQKVTKEDIKRVAQKYFLEDNRSIVSLVPQKFKQETKEKTVKTKKVSAIKKYTLPNGLILLIKEDRTLPTVSIKAIMRGGVLVENDDNNGISNMCAQLLLKGTKNRTAQEVAETIESAGGGISSYSGSNSFGVAIDILSDNKDIAFDILKDVLVSPLFAQKDIEREKEMILLNIKAIEDQPFQAASKLFRETMFKGHPYQYLSIGSKESVDMIDRKALKKFHEKYIVPDNMVLSVFGDVNAQEIENTVRKHFGELKKTNLDFKNTKLEFPRKIIKEKKIKEGKQAIVLLGFRGPDIYNQDKYPLEVLDAAFSGQGSRLFSAVREEEGLAYAVGSFLILGIDPGAFVFYVGTIPEKVDKVISLMQKEIDLLKKDGVTNKELTRIKNGLIGSRKIQLQSNSQLALLSALDEIYGLGYDNYLTYYDKIQDVNEKNIKTSAQEYFVNDDYVIVVVEPK